MTDPRPTDAQLSEQLAALLERERPERVVVVTGAGISAESGIPTFRGPEGYWTVGSREYHPQEMATQAAFRNMPREVWRWYLYRKGVCNAARPNPAHVALAQLEEKLGDRFTLVTQNVDGLHLIAGNSLERTLQVHGNTDYMRAIDGDRTPLPIPAVVPRIAREDPLTDDAWALLVTPDGRRTRPHILWFDEYYEELLYRSDSAIEAARRCDLLVVIGTSGAAAIPYHMAAEALRNDAVMIDINPDNNPFAEHAIDRARKQKGLWLQGSGTRWVPELLEFLT
ncbi:MAG TPA: Sir2 family NAD-dependent protein deacetylase [Enhygromyxa sp.]|nr:Sir2 family NAD-dependent protein deacetylase [Enhygromyxa sp.]